MSVLLLLTLALTSLAVAHAHDHPGARWAYLRARRGPPASDAELAGRLAPHTLRRVSPRAAAIVASIAPLIVSRLPPTALCAPRNRLAGEATLLRIANPHSSHNRRAQLDADCVAEVARVAHEHGAALRTESRWLNALALVGGDARLDAALRDVDCVARVAPFARRAAADDAAATDGVRRRAAGKTAPLSGPAEDGLYGHMSAQVRFAGLDKLHAAGYAGKGVRIALLDSGFYYTHPAFVATNIVAQYDFVDQDNDTADVVGSKSNQHGTATLSVLAATLKGVAYGAAPQAEYLLARTENIFVEERVEEDYYVAGAEWAERNGAHVISASLGYRAWYSFRDFDGHTPAVSRATQTAAELGLVVVVANGNEGEKGIGAPADARLALSAGACNAKGERASYSSIGPSADGRLKPDVTTIGSSIVVAEDKGGLRYGSGTSYAVPLIAALGALLQQAKPKWSAQMIHEAIMETSSQADAPDIHLGRGLVNASAALSFSPRITCLRHVPDIEPFPCYNGGLCDAPSNGAFCHCDENFYGRDCSLRRSPAPVVVGEWHGTKAFEIVAAPSSWAQLSSDQVQNKNNDNSSESYSSERDYGIESSDDFLSAADERGTAKVPFYASDASLAILGTVAVICVVVRLVGCLLERSGFASRMGYTAENRVPSSAMDSIVKMA